MSPRSRRLLAAVLILLLLGLIALLLARCTKPVAAEAPAASKSAPAETQASTPTPSTPAPTPAPKAEDLSPATVTPPAEIMAGAAFRVEWTGPNNPRDYVTIVRPAAPPTEYASYAETRTGSPLELTAPLAPGDYEVRYVTEVSKSVLGRAPITVTPITATLTAPAEAVLGTTLEVTWTGPNNQGDYITVVAKGTPDGRYDNYTETRQGSPLTIRMPTEAGDAELRYMTGQQAQVLARRPLRITMPEVSVNGPAEVTAGTVFTVTWVGPNNPGDYVTIVSRGTPDGRYQNYAETRKGSPLEVTALIEPGEAELRYMTGQGAKVLARRPIRIAAAKISLDAPAKAKAGAAVAVTWTGPDNAGDYITIVSAGTPDGQYAKYADTRQGSPVQILAPQEPGAAEIRYVSGQGSKVLARRPLAVQASE